MDTNPQPASAPDRISINATVTADHQAAAIHDLVRWRMKSLAIGPTIFGVGLVAGILIILTFILSARAFPAAAPAPPRNAVDLGFLVAVAIVLVIISIAMFACVAIPRHRLKRLSGGRNPLLGPTTIAFGPDGIERSGEHHRFHIGWQLVDTILQSPTTLWLLYASGDGWWIPCEAIGSPSDREAVIAFIRARTPGAKYKRLDARGRVV